MGRHINNKVTSTNYKSNLNDGMPIRDIFSTYHFVVAKNDIMEQPVRVVFRKVKNSMKVHCYLYVNHGGDFVRAYGSTSGCGYHKESEALYRACINAGITFREIFAGCGQSAMIDAMFALCYHITRSKNIEVFGV